MTRIQKGETWLGVRQALFMLVVGAVLTAAIALVWSWAAGGSYFRHASIAGMIIAALPLATGGNEMSGLSGLHARAWLGLGIGGERAAGYTGQHLTFGGIAMFYTLPLLLVSSLIYTL